MSDVEFKLLGRVEIVAYGTPVELGSAKERLLAALLLIRVNTVVPRDRIVEALWGDDAPAKPDVSIRAYASNLRRALKGVVNDPKTVLVSGRGGYSLHVDPELVDAVQFEKLLSAASDQRANPQEATETLERALSLVTGEPLADAAYADFAQAEVQRLNELILGAEELRAEMRIQSGDAGGVIAGLSALMTAHPLRESFRALHMTALAATGRHAEALRSYQVHRRRFVDEMGIEPGPGLRELETRILTEDSPFVAEPAPPRRQVIEQASYDSASLNAGPQRRHVTVMACVLATDSAAGPGSADRDPEDLRAEMTECMPLWAEVVESLGGLVLRGAGSGLAGHFGYPIAREDDAERAIRAGLEIVATSPLPVRVGVASGDVVVDPGASGADDALDVVGEAPLVARRLSDQSHANCVVVSDATRRLVPVRFRYREAVDGHSQVDGYVRPATTGFLAPAESATPVTGRAKELDILSEKFDLASSGSGQAVLLTGDPGVGKTRLVDATLERIAAEDLTVLRLQCSAFHQSTPLHPIVEFLLDAADCSDSDDLDTRSKKLDNIIARAPDPRAYRLLAPLAVPDRKPSISQLVTEPERRDEELVLAAASIISDAGRDSPCVCILEDAHWMDEHTVDLLGRLVDGVGSRRLLLLVTSRTEFPAEIAASAAATSLHVVPVTTEDCLTIARHVVGGRPIPTALEAEIVTKSDGIPLFVEEISKAILAADLLPEGEDSELQATPIPEFAVPATLRDSLLARLDRSPSARSVAQTAAAIGAAFDIELLSDVTGDSSEHLNDALDSLVAAGILIRRGDPPGALYRFKHALIRDTAHQLLLRENRRSTHRRIASSLESRWPAIAAADPARLARHWQAAGDPAAAITYWSTAAQAALEASSPTQSYDFASRGLALVGTFGSTDELTGRRLELLFSRGVAESQLFGPGAGVVGSTYASILAVGAGSMTPEQHFAALWGRWYFESISGNASAMRELADQLFRVAEHLNNEALLLEAHHVQWSSLLLAGEFERAVWHTSQVEVMYENEEHHWLTYTYGGHDPGPCMHGIGALASWLIGDHARGADQAARAMTLARRIDHGYTSVEASFGPLVIAALNCDEDRTASHTALVRQHVSSGVVPPSVLGLANGFDGAAKIAAGELTEGLSLMEDASALWGELWGPYCYPLDVAYANALGRSGDVDVALAWLERVLSGDDERRATWWDAELLREMAALLALEESDSPEVLQLFERAAATARDQGAKLLEVRALSALLRHQSTDAEASDRAALRLDDLLGQFPPDIDVVDVAHGRQLMADLLA